MFRIERFNFTVPSMKFSSGSLRLMNRKKGDSMRLQYIRVAVSYFILCILTGLLMLLIGNCFWHPNHACAGGLAGMHGRRGQGALHRTSGTEKVGVANLTDN